MGLHLGKYHWNYNSSGWHKNIISDSYFADLNINISKIIPKIFNIKCKFFLFQPISNDSSQLILFNIDVETVQPHKIDSVGIKGILSPDLLMVNVCICIHWMTASLEVMKVYNAILNKCINKFEYVILHIIILARLSISCDKY